MTERDANPTQQQIDDLMSAWRTLRTMHNEQACAGFLLHRAWQAATRGEVMSDRLRTEVGRFLYEFDRYIDDVSRFGEAGADFDSVKEMADVLRKAQQATSTPNMVLVPKEPSIGRLISMAIRDDHWLGVPGHYDQELFGVPCVTHAQRMEAAITRMRQLYEEATGQGLYNESREDEYRAMIAASEGK